MILAMQIISLTIEAELPENAPRYVMLSYELNHSDGRKSYPLVLVNWAPTSSETSLLTLHASAYLDFQKIVNFCFFSDRRHFISTNPVFDKADVSKVIDIRDGPESLTKNAIDTQLLPK